MKDWQERVLEENKELEARGIKLFNFIESPVYDTLPKFDRIALVTQFTYMQGYCRILETRIKEFEN